MLYLANKGQRWFIGGVYLLMLAGGVWHQLGMFTQLRQIMAAPLLIGLTIGVSLATVREFSTPAPKNSSKAFLCWACFVIVASFLIEWFGVHSGLIFGRYQYGAVLRPQIDSVPIAIGFAWLLSVMGAMAISQQLLGNWGRNTALSIFSAASILVVFDLFLEKAAIKLGYWHWQNDQVPLQNYLAWFIIGTFFIAIAAAAGLLRRKWPKYIMHLFIAQMIYFLMVSS